MTDIRLVPYCEIDGIRTYSDSEIAALYDRMEMDKTAKDVFYDGSVKNRAEFVAMAKKPGTYLYVVIEKGNPDAQFGIVWLNRVEFKRAWFHFCFFSNVWGARGVEIGKAVISQLTNMKNNAGDFVIDSLLGVVPKANPKAINFVKRCGGILLCDLIYGSWNGNKNANETGTLFQYLRNEQ